MSGRSCILEGQDSFGTVSNSIFCAASPVKLPDKQRIKQLETSVERLTLEADEVSFKIAFAMFIDRVVLL